MEKKNEKPVKKSKLTKSEFVIKTGIQHLNSKEKKKKYLEYLR